MNYQTKFLGKKKVAEDTYMFSFEKPKGFQYQAGQFSSIFLPDYTDEKPRDGKHTFSITSNPKDKELEFATRVRKSDFKKGIMKLKAGDKVNLAHPGGSMVLPETEAFPLVFLVGGIGITPVRSILHYATQIKKKFNIKVIWSNRNEKTAPFFKELKNDFITNKHENIELVTTFTEKGGSSPAGEKGRINIKLIEKVAGKVEGNMYFVVGTESFTEAMSKMLQDAGVKPEEIRGDTFYDYD